MRSKLLSASLALVWAVTVPAQTLLETLVPAGAISNDAYGQKVVVHGDLALVKGLPGLTVFERVAGVWVDQGPLVLTSTTFGNPIGLAFDLVTDGASATLVIGSITSGGVGGTVWVFDRVGGAWVEQEVLTQTGPVPRAFASVSITGSATEQVIAAGAPGLINPFGGIDGFVEVWRRDVVAGTVSHEARMPATNANNGTLMGWSVDVEGDLLVAGQPDSGYPQSDTGKAWIFGFDGNSWVTEGTATMTGSESGKRVVVDGETILLISEEFSNGLPNSQTRASFVERNSLGNWASVHSVLIPGGPIYGAAMDQGIAIISGQRNVVGQPGQKETHFLERFGGIWSTLYPTAINLDGREVALHEGTALIGDTLHDELGQGVNVGAVHVYDVPSTPDCNSNGIPDATDIANGTSLDLDLNGVPDECGGLTSDRTTLGIVLGGTANFDLDAGVAEAGNQYFMLGSITGSLPGIPLSSGQVLPVNYDAFTLFALQASPLYTTNVGVLDANGMATAAFSVPPLDLFFLGLPITHAFLAIDAATGIPSFVSNPTPLTLTLF